ncbi:MAG: ABC transporter permease [Phenylobacterium sp.]|uniref:ABC transporter permease n=2 Tax=Phenylobacterium sp. TaxID=1871053 RepID=UPI0017D5FEBE|nr:ABC transporter permease [Phenylobacterium sp.]MBA4792980.1 ABC transporter permease [Phenylobacterium sp.]
MRPSALHRKLLRDLWRFRWQELAIALLVACGVSVGVMAYSAQEALERAQADFYQETHFADVFAQAERAPASAVTRLAALDGVVSVDPRILEVGLLDVPGLVRPATARLISLPEHDDAGLNRVRLSRGRMPDPARLDEAVALQTFLDAAGVALNDELTAVIGGRAITFRIVGAVHSPEYIFTPSPESFLPDDAHQGVFWAPRPAVERAAGLHGAFNAVSLKLAPGASAPATLRAVDQILAPYGGLPAYGREDQVSHAFLEAELDELATSAAIIPPVFLIVAAALVHMVMARLIETEREQIGLLKAFGYEDRAAAANYLWMALAIGLLGAAAGGVAGAGFGAAIMEQYRQYFRFPDLSPAFSTAAFAVTAAAAVAATAAGSLLTVRGALRLSPAIAMQPPRPAAYRRGWIDRLIPERRLDQATRIILRNLERFPLRAGLSVSGLAASLALLVGTQFVFGSLDWIIDHAYYRAQRWSESVGFAEARGATALDEARRLPGVYAAEPVRIVAARIRAGGQEERLRITGLDPSARMNRPLDGAGRPVPIIADGLILSEALAGKMAIEPGDQVSVEITQGRAPRIDLTVTGLAQDFSGYSAYMDRTALNRLMADGAELSGAQLLVATDRRPDFYRAIAAIPQVIGASSRDDTVATWRRTMVEAFRVTMTFYVGFAGAIAFGVAYNTSRIALSERARDLATLRVLGFGRVECAYILLGELLILGLVALPAGVLGGHALARGLVAAYGRDEFRLPLILTPASHGVALAAYFVALGLAAVLVGRQVWRLDLITALKTRE